MHMPKAYEKKSQAEVCDLFSMRRVVGRSFGVGSSMIPPSEFEKPHKPAKPTDLEQFGMIAYVVAVAVATVAATTLGGALAFSTPELAINIVARVGVSCENLYRVDVAGPRSSGQCPQGALGCSTDGMPKSVNNTVLALGSSVDDFHLGVAARGLGDGRRSPMSKGS